MVNFDKQFKNLLLKEQVVSHYFQPHISLADLPRHDYYPDLKEEFINDIKTFGFSPYITETAEFQKKNPTMQKFDIKRIQRNGYLNYIKSSNVTNKMERILQNELAKKAPKKE